MREKNINSFLKKVEGDPIFLGVIFKDKSPLSNALHNNSKDYIHCNSRI